MEEVANAEQVIRNDDDENGESLRMLIRAGQIAAVEEHIMERSKYIQNLDKIECILVQVEDETCKELDDLIGAEGVESRDIQTALDRLSTQLRTTTRLQKIVSHRRNLDNMMRQEDQEDIKLIEERICTGESNLLFCKLYSWMLDSFETQFMRVRSIMVDTYRNASQDNQGPLMIDLLMDEASVVSNGGMSAYACLISGGMKELLSFFYQIRLPKTKLSLFYYLLIDMECAAVKLACQDG